VRQPKRELMTRTLYRFAWRAFELLHGLDTTGSIDASELGHDEQRFGYQPIDYHTFLAALRPLAKEDRRGTFIDYGCGKGRAVLLASFRHFREVIGVERSAELCAIARRNIERSATWRRAASVRIVEQDATQFVVPDDADLLFFYNPFRGAVMAEVLGQIRASLARRPRRMHLIYALPNTDPDAMAECSWLRPWRSVSTCNHAWEKLTIYRPLAFGNGRDSS